MTAEMAGIPTTMRVVEIREPGAPDVLQMSNRATPEPAADEVLIQVAAAGVNRPDCLQRRGLYPPPKGASDLPGLEVAGLVAATGDAVTTFTVGDTVCALLAGGGYAEYCVVPAVQCLPIPKNITLVDAAAIPETFLRYGPMYSSWAALKRANACPYTVVPAASAHPPFKWPGRWA